eukprot:CAMPEP_0119304838 /NCGR_PEP_ID=MMETSP1333-20130426/5964_1 /TAXON_ID=418940 /ORGANISM="Scyphosphaera apsteinii, Strain RCC1455" /LENGTH=118 /DNA_ID=CAMNT_0007307787 /DNA_START=106 /DNA_END=459 /DNA_ORIENTATION=-
MSFCQQVIEHIGIDYLRRSNGLVHRALKTRRSRSRTLPSARSCACSSCIFASASAVGDVSCGLDSLLSPGGNLARHIRTRLMAWSFSSTNSHTPQWPGGPKATEPSGIVSFATSPRLW